MNRETLKIYLYGGPTVASKKLLAKWPIEVYMSTHRNNVAWKSVRKYQLDYSPRSDVVLTCLKVSSPKGVRHLLSKLFVISAGMPLHVQRGNTITVLMKQGQQTIILSS